MGIRGKRELTEIYFWKERDTNGGLVVIAAQANELTIVNIVGRVDLASLGGLGTDDSKAAGRDAKGDATCSYLMAISNTRGHSLPVTKIRFFWASNAIPLSTASALSFAVGAPSSPLRLIHPSTRPSFGEIRTM